MILLGALLLVTVGANSALVMAGDQDNKEGEPQIHVTWTVPTSGTPVDHYLVQVLVNERDTMEIGPLAVAEVTFTAEFGNKYRVKVAAVDAAGVQGPYSLWSEPLSPELGPPSF